MARSNPGRWRRALLATLALLAVAIPSCAPGFDPPSIVNTLRILAVTADKPYALPGETVTMRMTVHDGLREEPRPLQILWLGGCFDPEGDQVFLCFPQFAETLAPLAELEPGDPLPPEIEELIAIDLLPSAASGQPGASEFSFTLPEDIVSRRPVPAAGPHYGIAFVFFAACAGQLAPAPLETPGGSDVPDFPLTCRNVSGEELGSDSFVIGYTQVYSFADERSNDNPSIDDLSLDGMTISADPAEAPVVSACPVTRAQRRQASCGSDEPTNDCTNYAIDVVVGDVAEVDPDAIDAEGRQLSEIVWASYFVDGGDLSSALRLVSDAVQGPIDEHQTKWIPPAEPGDYNIWAVLRDQRGGQSIMHRRVRVE